MRIWIVNYYTGTPETASNPRYLQLAHHFRQAGFDVVTFNADYKGDVANPMFVKATYGEHHFVHVKSPHYVGNGLKRMASIWSFAWRIYRRCKEFEKPDVILHNIHPPFDYPIIWASKKLGCKYIAEAWDLWPEDFVTFGLVSRRNPILKLFYQLEKKMYYHANQLIFTFMGSFDYLKRKGWTTETGGKIDMSKVHYINNGIDLEQFDKDKVSYPRNDVYMGSINLANHVPTLVEAAKLLQEDKRYHFFIYGDGAQREYLERYVEEHHMENVHFKEKRIPLSNVAWVVSQATVNVMNYEKGFGHVGVSSGKMFQYLAAGKPIVCNIDIAYDDVITDNHLGIARDMEKAEDFSIAIRNLAEQPKASYDAMCERVRKVAERFDYKRLAAQEIDVIKACFKNEKS